MKNLNLKIIAVLIFCMLLIPLFALPREKSPETKETAATTKTEVSRESKSQEKTDEPEEKTEKGKEKTGEEKVRVQFHDSGKIETLEMSEYIFSVVSAECPMLYEDEALKAQIIAAATYTRYLMDLNAESEYDVTTDYNLCQGFIEREEAEKNWGDNAEKYSKRLESLIDETLNLVITYKGKPIFAAYHGISSGATEYAKNVWGNEVAYLKSVESIGDKLSQGYLSEAEFTYAQIDEKLKEQGITGNLLKTAKLEKTSVGNVLWVKMGDKKISGGELGKALGLRSQNFEMTSTDEKIKFTVKGFGHQCGMSQNGANYMAKSGKTYKEILLHYYKGVKIEEW